MTKRIKKDNAKRSRSNDDVKPGIPGETIAVKTTAMKVKGKLKKNYYYTNSRRIQNPMKLKLKRTPSHFFDYNYTHHFIKGLKQPNN